MEAIMQLRETTETTRKPARPTVIVEGVTFACPSNLFHNQTR